MVDDVTREVVDSADKGRGYEVDKGVFIPVEDEEVSKELARIENQTDKLIDAYQEGIMGIDELRSRVPELKKRQVSLQKEFESLTLQTLEHGRLLEVNVSLEKFMEQLKNSAQNLDIQQKQKIVRLLVREVVLSPGTATIHHSIPLPQHRDGQKIPTYRLCPRGHSVTNQCLRGYH